VSEWAESRVWTVVEDLRRDFDLFARDHGHAANLMRQRVTEMSALAHGRDL
jgi:tetrahydromethanopterin S-methyltransferase subunit F